MTSNDVYERLGVLEHLVQHLYEKTGLPMPDLQTLAPGDKIGAIKAYRDATNVDLATARRIIESL